MVSKNKSVIRFISGIALVAIYIVFSFGAIYSPTTQSNYLIFSLFLFNYLVSVILSIYILNSKRYESFKSLWILWIIVTPILGQIFFIFFGVSGIQRRSLIEYRADAAEFLEHENYKDSTELKTNMGENFPLVFDYLREACGRPIYKGNNVQLLLKPQDILAKILATIEKAENFIHLQYYIIEPGYVWDAIVEALERKVVQGVEVRIIVDYLGSFFTLKKKDLLDIRRRGIQIYYFNGFSHWKNLSILNFRCHKKILIVDNKYSVYGSTNLSDSYFGISGKIFPLNDYCYYIEGKIVNSFNLLFAYDWKYHCDNLISQDDLIKNPEKYFKIHQTADPTNTIMQFAESSPDINEKIFVNNLNQLILRSKKSIEIATPYFYPSIGIINALKIAADSGVKIRLILPRQPDYVFPVLTMNRFFYQTLLESGVEIYEYFGFNHEKIMVVDDELIYTGTYNWDFRSLFLNYESVLLIYSKKMAQNHLDAFCFRLSKSERVSFENRHIWNSWKQKFGAFWIRLFFPLI